jgi:uncharacterized protein YhdP
VIEIPSLEVRRTLERDSGEAVGSRALRAHEGGRAPRSLAGSLRWVRRSVTSRNVDAVTAGEISTDRVELCPLNPSRMLGRPLPPIVHTARSPLRDTV